MNTGNEGLELRSEDEDRIVGYVDSDAVNNESGAKAGAVAAADPLLSAIIATRPSLAEAKQDNETT